MPELPEMQALAERLDARLRGSILRKLEILGFSSLKTVSPTPGELQERELAAVERRGKYLVFDFGGPRALVHLSQGGRLDLEEPPKRTVPRGSVARMGFTADASLLIKEFGKERKAGLWLLATGDEGPLVRLGPDPFSDAFEELIVAGTDARRVNTMLRDQRTVAGIGRGYADDTLHTAQLSPFARLSKLDLPERRRLLDSIRRVLKEALAIERQRSGGLPTKIGDHFAVHGRSGEPCPRCGSDLRRVSFASYEITYCPACQTGGKLLADRRMSRLLK